MKLTSRFLLALLSNAFLISALAQSSANYNYSTAANASMAADKNGNALNFSSVANLIATNTSTTNSSLQSIGFDFVLMGKRYSHFIAGNDGQLGLGLSTSPAAMLSASSLNNLWRTVSYPPTAFNDAPVIAAFWSDLRTARTGATVRSVVVGTAPNRCLAVQWNAVVNANSITATDPADAVFQARLYESTGEIEYVYGKMSIGTGSTNVSASIGFTAGAADNAFVGIKDLSTYAVTRLLSEVGAANNLVSSSTAGNIASLHSTADGSRRKFSFAPVALNGAFTSASVTRVYATTMQLNWAETSTNRFGYLIYRSDGNASNYQWVATLPASATSYVAIGLQPNTRYYWRVVPFNEGATREQVLTDSTRCSMAGTYSVGPTGTFTTLKAAHDSMQLWGLLGNATWELQSSYSFSNEVLPVTIKGAVACQNNTQTLTVRPAAGASLSFINPSTTPVLLLDSTNRVVLDGRAGGSGASALQLEGSGELVKLKNSWNDTIQYVALRSNTNTTATALTLDGAAGGGCHDNLILNCSFGDRSGSIPLRLLSGILSGAAANDNNAITGCEFFNFRRFAVEANGRGWVLNNNSFYATAPVTATDTSGFLWLRNPDTTLPHQVTNNYFGGTAAGGFGNALDWTADLSFAGVWAEGRATITNNNFRRLHIRCATTNAYPEAAVDLVRLGRYTASTPTTRFIVQQNYFGGSALADSICVSSSASQPVVTSAVAHVLPAGQATIANNAVLNWRTYQTGTGDLSLRILQSGIGTAFFQNNTVGTFSHAVRIVHNGKGSATGIYSSYAQSSITNNTVTNFVARYNVTGIATADNFQPIENNTISHVKSLQGGLSGNWYSAAGIATYRGSQSVSRNRIFHIEDSSLAGSYSPTSLFVNGSNNTITRNFIDGLIQNPQAPPKLMRALRMADNNSLITNNMVRVGVDSAGNAVRGQFMCYSADDYTAGNPVRHNTFLITGAGLPSTEGQASYNLSAPASTIYINNIIVNTRTITDSSLGAMGTYFYSGSNATYNQGGTDYNVYYRTGYGNFSTDASFVQWQTFGPTGRDQNSLIMPPNFVRPEGPTRTLDLHLQGYTPAERRGVAYTTVTDDFDGETRASLTPVDIGADAGNYTEVDLRAPWFTVTPLVDATDTSSRTITIRIQDSVSGVAQGLKSPTIWYRKFYPTTTPWQMSYGNRVSGGAFDGQWQFRINHGLLNPSPFGADSVEYYFVAQDSATFPSFNIGTSPMGGIHATTAQAGTPPPVPYRYRINVGRYLMPPIVEVGEGKRYTSLTRDGGVFEGLAKDSVQGDVTVRITSHLAENGKWGVDSLLRMRGLKLSIVPGYDSTFVIKNNGNLSAEMLRFAGTANVTIDGSYNGAGRWLRFVSQGTTAALSAGTILFTNGFDNVRIQNCELQSTAPGFQQKAIVYLRNGDFKNLTLRNNVFSSVPGQSLVAGTGFNLLSDAKLTNLVAAENHFVNLENGGLLLYSISQNLRIDSNQFYWNWPQPQTGTNYWAIGTSGNNSPIQVKGNYIGGSAPFCGGSYWVNNGAFNDWCGLKVGSSSNAQSLVSENRVRNVKTTGTSGNYFSAITAYGGTFLLDRNIIGDSTNSQSIVTAAGSPTLMAVGDKLCTVSNNLIAGVECTNTGNVATLQVLRLLGDSDFVVRNNVIRNISMASTATGSSAGTLTAIAAYLRTTGSRIEQNEIFNLSCTSSLSVQVSGIQALSGTNSGATLSGNRIYNFSLPNSNGGLLRGIWLYQNGVYKVQNNQISLTNGTATNPVNVYGIHSNLSFNTSNDAAVAYNSVYIGGSQSAGNTQSFGFYQDGIGTTSRFKNNLVYNGRSGGTGQHGGIGIKQATPVTNWAPGISDFNLFVVNDTAKAHLWGTTTQLTMRGWKAATGGDASSYVALAQSLSPASFFTEVTKGNLNINNTNPVCWYVNGKGVPLPDLADDFGATGVRSIATVNGPTDIGSDEFNTTSTPPALDVFGRHQPGGADTLSMNGRTVAIIQWGAAGTLPTLGTARFYSGVWPNDPTNGGAVSGVRSLSGFVDVPATGGSGYSYNLQLFYDSSMIGRVTASHTMVMNKKQSGVSGSWTEVHPNVVDTAKKTITGYNLSSFSEFTATDSLATYVSGGALPDLTIATPSIAGGSIATGGPFNVSFTETNTGAAAAPAHVVRLYLSSDAVLTPGTNGDSLLGEYNVTTSIAASGSSGTLTKSVVTPCGLTAGNYYVFVIADGSNLVAESNEANNSASASVPLTIGQTVPAASVSVTNNGVVCGTSPVTLTASATGCLSCAYTWNTGASGTALSVATAGTYTVTVTNVCGSNNASRVVTAGSVPPTPTITQSGNQLLSSAASGNQWYLNGNAISGATGNSYAPQATGQYSVVVTANGCTSLPSATFNYVITAVGSPQLMAQLIMAPNPVQSKMLLQYNGPAASFELRLYDLAGREVKPTAVFTTKYWLDMQGLLTGLYFMEIKNRRSLEAVRQTIVKQ